jgi:hypothetical protein
MAIGECHVATLWEDATMIPMSIMTLHQNDVTIESLQLLACWKHVSQDEEPFHVSHQNHRSHLLC